MFNVHNVIDATEKAVKTANSYALPQFRGYLDAISAANFQFVRAVTPAVETYVKEVQKSVEI